MRREKFILTVGRTGGSTGGGHLMVLTDTSSARAQWSSVEQDIALVISLPVTPPNHRT